jgi:hypothetical protein
MLKNQFATPQTSSALAKEWKELVFFFLLDLRELSTEDATERWRGIVPYDVRYQKPAEPVVSVTATPKNHNV